MKRPRTKLSIAKTFSREPAGRYRTDSDFSGEVFRDEHLLPALDQFDEVEVDLDGTEGYGSSFLEEAFGGALRKGVPVEDLRHRVKLISEEDPTLIDEILQYVEQEHARRTAARR